jgi:hypothetical protein
VQNTKINTGPSKDIAQQRCWAKGSKVKGRVEEGGGAGRTREISYQRFDLTD